MGTSGYLSILRGVSLVMVIRIAGAVLTYSSHVVLARWLGTFEFGIFAYTWVWVTILGFIAPLGLNDAVVKFLPDYLAKHKWRRVIGVIGFSSIIVLLSGALLGCLAALILYLIRDWVPHYYLMPLYIAFACIPLFALSDLYQDMARGFGWIKLAFSPSYVLRPGLLMIMVGLLILSKEMITSTIAMAIAFYSCLFALIVQFTVFHRALSLTLPKIKPVYHTRYWLRTSFPFFIIGAFYLILANTDIIMLGHFLDPDAVAMYFATVRTSGLIAFIFFAVSSLAAPRFSSLHAQKKYQELRDFYIATVHMTFWPSLLVGMALLIFGESILAFFGTRFIEGYSVLALLILGILFEAAAGPVSFLLNMTGHQVACAQAVGIIALLNIVLNAVLIPTEGLIGAATATTLSIVIRTVWFSCLAIRHLHISPLDILKRRDR